VGGKPVDTTTIVIVAIVLVAVVLIAVFNPRLRSIAIRLPGKLSVDVKNDPQHASVEKAKTPANPNVELYKAKLKRSGIWTVLKGRVLVRKSSLEDSPITISQIGDQQTKEGER
jgi:hypothetical protein